MGDIDSTQGCIPCAPGRRQRSSGAPARAHDLGITTAAWRRWCCDAVTRTGRTMGPTKSEYQGTLPARTRNVKPSGVEHRGRSGISCPRGRGLLWQPLTAGASPAHDCCRTSEYQSDSHDVAPTVGGSCSLGRLVRISGASEVEGADRGNRVRQPYMEAPQTLPMPVTAHVDSKSSLRALPAPQLSCYLDIGVRARL
ncbi:hypothetical protein BC628DRAFT_613170 [Trametes gibbosa]|nr:hypothetical protein BC628DRAFT_613170 [Trametes gibbosa]